MKKIELKGLDFSGKLWGQVPTSERFQFVDGQLAIGKGKYPVGIIPYTAHRTHERPSSIYISVHAGRWYVSFSMENPEPECDEMSVAVRKGAKMAPAWPP